MINTIRLHTNRLILPCCYSVSAAEILPATHFMRIIRAVVLRGGELTDIPFDTL